MNTSLYKKLFSVWLILFAAMTPLSIYADDDTGDVNDAESAAMAKTKANALTWQETDPNGENYLSSRKALVGRHCAVNRVINVVSVGSGTSGLENLTNEDLTDYASFPSTAGVTIAASPTVSVRDMKNYYAGGTTAGFCIVASSGSSVVNLDVIKTMHIWFYCDGKRVADQTVREGNGGSGVKLSLIGIPGSQEACVNLTAKCPEKFDEVALVQGGGLDVSVASLMRVKYAFVGDAHDIYITTNGIKKYCTDNGLANTWNVKCTAWMPLPLLNIAPVPVVSSFCARAIDDDLTNTVPLVSAVQLASLGSKGWADIKCTNSDASVQELFHKGDQVGVKYNFVEVADVLKLGSWVELYLYDKNGEQVQSTTISANVLSLSIASGGDQTAYILADKDFSGVGIKFFTAAGVLNLGSGFGVYYAFVRPKAEVEHECLINPSCNTNICGTQTTLQLKSNPALNIRWEKVSEPEDNHEACNITSDGFITGMNADGTYKFKAISEDGCTEIVTINHGESEDFMEPLVEHALYNIDEENKDYELSDDLHGEASANLLSISDMTGAENVLNGDLTDYASYTAGLQLLGSNGVIVGVKKVTEGSPYIYDGSKADAKESIRVGFVIEMEQTALGLNLLDAFQIRCFDDAGNRLYSHIVEDAGVLGLNLIGSNNKSNKLRLSITVPKVNGDGIPVKINEFQLWKIGALDLKVSDVKIYYAFWDDPTDAKNNIIRDGATVVTYDNMGAIVNVGTQVNVASVGGVTNNLSNIIDIDEELETYALMQKTVEAGSQEIIVKLGKTLDYRHQVGVVVNNDIVGLNANVGNVLKVGTYYNGQETGEESTNWGVLGANVIQGSGKTVLLIQPKSDYDEIHITAGQGLGVNRTIKIYGILIRNDIDNDGVPDNRDESSCPTVSVDNISTNKVCKGSTLTVTATGTTGTNYKISLPDQNVTMRAITSEQDGSISVNVETVKAGRFTLYFYDGNEMLISTSEYIVHPTQTTWRTTTNNKDWNRWENWSNGSPYLCTDVIIPSNARAYPSLDGSVTNGDEFGCDRVYFESRAAIEKVFKLNYTKAWVNVELTPNRYYLLSVPLQEIVTGDMFISDDANLTETAGYPFTEITGSNYDQNRFSPRIYQRLYEKAGGMKWGNGDFEDDAATIQETRWSKRFNALKYGYAAGEGFSLWVDPEENENSEFTFRFPKTHEAYNYYNELTKETQGEETGITRSDASYRFAFEQGKTAIPYTYKESNDRKLYHNIGDLTITANAEETTKVFLLGNPFMSHIDVEAFLEANKDVISEVKAYDGNTTTSAIAVSGTYIATDNTFKTIRPMEAFFVVAKEAATSLAVTLNEDMFKRAVMDADISDDIDSDELPAMTISVRSGNVKAHTLLLDEDDNTRTETLFDNEILPRLAVFTIAGEQALDINSVKDKHIIPLGIYSNVSDSITLEFLSNGGFDLSRYYLVDRMYGTEYQLNERPRVVIDGACLNRFYLTDGSITSINKNHVSDKADGVYITFNHQQAVVHSDKDDIENVDVFSLDGKLVTSVKAACVNELGIHAPVNTGIIRVKRKGLPVVQHKFMKP